VSFTILAVPVEAIGILATSKNDWASLVRGHFGVNEMPIAQM
jgi:hypothetical protein